MQPFKHIIFDFDGTIADSFTEALAVFQLLTKRQEPLAPEVVAELRSYSMREVMRQLGVRPWQVPLMLLHGRRFMTARMGGVKPFPGIAEALAALTARGHRLYVISSNSTANITGFLQVNGLGGYFDGVYGGIGLIKRRALLGLMRRRRLRPSDCVYVGDETRDVDAARAVNVAVLAVTWGFNAAAALSARHPAALVQAPGDLAAQVERLGA